MVYRNTTTSIQVYLIDSMWYSDSIDFMKVDLFLQMSIKDTFFKVKSTFF